ncbi:enoyl-CoA hydratase [Nisaea acidiphila]|uniref:Enoyl-CoA hydratase n=1 Tax=Nisaea acidiphila TaxID=1862145 RepID=A0A9J7ATR7_9PROT|nr:enoyl-CoA hydratase [Nisaea acidiphila]UUX49716.1 enoyl-CoA hydratase [Nisaea acidiphila]
MPVEAERREVGTGSVVTLTWDNAAKLNIVNSEAIGELTVAISELEEDDSLRALVLRGAGKKAFIGGADINEMAACDAEKAEAFISRLHGLMKAIRDCRVPVIAAIDGYCLGAGMEIAAACDIRISSDNAKFGMPEVKVGIPSVIEAALLPRLIGWGKASYLVYTGATIDARTARDWGFVERMVTPESLFDSAAQIGREIAEAGPAAIRIQKQLLKVWEEEPLEAGIESGIEAFAAAYETGEPQAMMQAFLAAKKKGAG